MLDVGDAVPEVTLKDADGVDFTLARYRGKPLVVYFYPKADTPGCTSEAKDFTALAADFAALGVPVVGISKDKSAKLKKFAEKYGLTVTLASDEPGEMCEAFGTWVEKSLYGRKYMGIERATFLVGADGKILHVWPKVKVKGHAAEVLEAGQGL
ncbi:MULTISPECIES: thioredoxin-dependent thiol peroxidase [Sphingobium]|uniref:thioredoxin-dependent peroxiredoxin n=1 Tax=Sphingobium fuliginis (strain ATCC 27551) TaxID=336203 RepID=A0ABQ1EPG8_SPHSA|nr:MULTISPECIES: thioredoxin-dependent thiol peroxidase [Sphingobium]AJR22450.1 alkyl hydroperoxide reductase [Sphingobium sp. YBL2]RYM01403.1 thioredoxin-dependent thiol peroxidase [Sphingobium fuliginis]UXC92626.1 thioredoxin-dependent thiol peroxidase [Sphingobium sp. RSMS]WDA39046.1 thioredoxin-dependent thiol peroxidase [Sphingobium sp. YC-XJ3]GFZ80103.1 peroxiredoxin [Sphingobium fuliginis]